MKNRIKIEHRIVVDYIVQCAFANPFFSILSLIPQNRSKDSLVRTDLIFLPFWLILALINETPLLKHHNIKI